MFCPPRYPALETGCGQVRLHWPACRRLRVVEHAVRRDRDNRLVVRLQVENRAEAAAPVRITVRFRDARGTVEPTAVRTAPHTFPPGLGGAVEWRSYSPDADSYAIDIAGEGLLP